MTTMKFAVALSASIFFVCSVTPGQNRSTNSPKCGGPVFESKDVAQRAKIVEYPDTSVLARVATEYKFHGIISAKAVLCRSGQVTNIEVTQPLPQNLDTFVIDAIGTTRFTPAESNWHSVSQHMQFQIAVNDDSAIVQIEPSQAEGLLVERVVIKGNRYASLDQLKSFLNLKVGEPFRAETVRKDLQSILSTGLFVPGQSRVYMETGARGGVGVVFEVVERPFIKQIDFEGLTLDSAAVSEALKTLTAIGIEPGKRYSVEKMGQAIETLKLALKLQGVPVTKVDLQGTLADAMNINLKFVISK